MIQDVSGIRRSTRAFAKGQPPTYIRLEYVLTGLIKKVADFGEKRFKSAGGEKVRQLSGDPPVTTQQTSVHENVFGAG